LDINITGVSDPEANADAAFQVFDRELGDAIYRGYGGMPPRRNR
jgi:hypothetical protein